MEKCTPIELTKIKKIIANIHEFPAKIDSTDLAKTARKLLKKYALLSEKIERNVLIRATYQKDLASLRTKEFKAIRRTLKENANSILHAKNNKDVQSKKLTKKPTKTAAPKKASKTEAVKVAKKSSPKKTVTKASPKPRKAAAPKKDA
jgi:uncharacterized membrane protein YgaE (UPF0421/DUF939 family)